MPVRKGNALVAIPSFLYRRLTQYDKSLYRKFLPLVLIAYYAPGEAFPTPRLEALTEHKLDTYLESLLEGKVLEGTVRATQQMSLRLFPVRGVSGDKLFRAQLPESQLQLVEKLLRRPVDRWATPASDQVVKPGKSRPARRVRAAAPVEADTATSVPESSDDPVVLQRTPLAIPQCVLPLSSAPAEYYVGSADQLLQREGKFIVLPEAQARHLARAQAYLEQRPYYLYQVQTVRLEEITPDDFTLTL